MKTKFMLLYLAPVSAEQQMNVSPEEMKKGMEPWEKWFGKYGEAIVDQGMPLGKAKQFSKNGRPGSKTQVAGYSIVQADSLKSVEAMLKDHPHLMQPNGSIEVLEYISMQGM